MRSVKIIFTISLLLLLTTCSGNDNKRFIETTGIIEAKTVTISSKNVGEIKNILKNEGDKISSGDTILTIENETLVYQLEQSAAAVQIAEAQLNLLIKGARTEDINQAEELLNQAESNFSLAKNDFERFAILWESKSITQKQYEEVKNRYNVSLAQLTSAKENHEKIKRIFRDEEIDQAKANLKKAKAAEELVKKSFRDSYVRSPINGFLVRQFVETGESVSPMSALVKISHLSQVFMMIYISEAELGKIKLGQKAEITINTFTDKIFEGKVTYISPEAEFTPKNIQTKDERTKLVFAVKIEIDNSELSLKPGMPADAKVFL